MSQRKRFLLPVTAAASALFLAGCAGSGGTSVGSGDGTDGNSSSSNSGVEETSQGASTAGSGTAQTVSTAGAEIKAIDTPVGGEITNGAGEIVMASSDSIDAFSTGLDEGLGNYRDNENFLGTTLAGGTESFAESGDAVVAGGEMIESMNGMPVFMQVDDSSGAVTALGGTVSDLGVEIKAAGNQFTAEISDENSTFGGGVAELSAVVQPVLIKTEDGIGTAGDAVLIGPVGSEMLDESAALFMQGAGIVGAADPRLSGPGEMMSGGAQMVSGAGKLLTNGEEGENPFDSEFSGPSAIEGATTAAGGAVEGTGDTVSILGGAITQVDAPAGSGVTTGAGEVVQQAGAGVSGLGAGIKSGIGSYRSNENFLGATAAGLFSPVSHTGLAVAAGGDTVTALNTLPVFMQIDESTGVVTTLGGTVGQLGMEIADFGNSMRVQFAGENGIPARGTEELSGVVRPILTKTEGGVGVIGDALVVGPVGSDVLSRVGGVFVDAGDRVSEQDARLMGIANIVGSAGLLVSSGGQLLTNGGEAENPFAAGVPGELVNGNPGGVLADLTNGADMIPGDLPINPTMLLGAFDLSGGNLSIDGLSQIGGESGLLDGVSGTLAGLTGGLDGLSPDELSNLSNVDQSSLNDLTASLDGVAEQFSAIGSSELTDALAGEVTSMDALQGNVDAVTNQLSVGDLDSAGIDDLSGALDAQDADLSGATGELEGVTDDVAGELSEAVSGLIGGSL